MPGKYESLDETPKKWGGSPRASNSQMQPRQKHQTQKDLELTFCFDGLTTLKFTTQLEQIIRLNLQCNQLRSIEFVHKMKHLEFLDISHNLITSLRGIENHPSLIILIAGCNRITRAEVQALYSTRLLQVELKQNQVYYSKEKLRQADPTSCNCDQNPIVQEADYPFSIYHLLPTTIQVLDSDFIPLQERAMLSGKTEEDAAVGMETLVLSGYTILGFCDCRPRQAKPRAMTLQ